MASLLTAADKDFKPYAKLFQNPKGFYAGVPAQFTMGPEHFCGEFHLLYQISKEDEAGERFDFRIFYRDINGLIVKRWVNEFNKHFCAKVIDRIKATSPFLQVHQFEAVAPLRNQLDFLILGIPGRFIEEVIDLYFRMIKAKV